MTVLVKNMVLGYWPYKWVLCDETTAWKIEKNKDRLSL